jgi:hypothetical protein
MYNCIMHLLTSVLDRRAARRSAVMRNDREQRQQLILRGAWWALFVADADVRTPSQASTMVPWHGRQTMEIEDDSNPEDDA